jgi:hypothetical protein
LILSSPASLLALSPSEDQIVMSLLSKNILMCPRIRNSMPSFMRKELPSSDSDSDSSSGSDSDSSSGSDSDSSSGSDSDSSSSESDCEEGDVVVKKTYNRQTVLLYVDIGTPNKLTGVDMIKKAYFNVLFQSERLHRTMALDHYMGLLDTITVLIREYHPEHDIFSVPVKSAISAPDGDLIHLCIRG